MDVFWYLFTCRFKNADYNRIDHDVDQLNNSQNSVFGRNDHDVDQLNASQNPVFGKL